MKRLFWIAAGAAAGVMIARKLTKTAKNFTPEGAADQVAGKVGGIKAAFRDFADDVRTGMAERENELRYAVGIADNGREDVDVDDLHALSETGNDYPRGT